jgi:endonuclease/exonuclease/phosphatase (EEP) superfamily protein YafD
MRLRLVGPINMAEAEQHKPNPLRFRIRLSGMIGTAGAVACTATVLGFCGRFGWLLDLFSHFRVQYFLALVVAAALLLFSQQRKTAACLGVFAIINLVVILPLYFGRTVEAGEHESMLRAMLINVKTESGDPILVAKTLSEMNPQIVVLEEINSRWLIDLKESLQAYPNSCVRPREDNFGIGLFSKFPLSNAAVVDIGEVKVPSILADVRIGTTTLRVIATHPLPPAGARYSQWRNSHLDRIPDYVPNDGSSILLLGDLNVSPWNHHFKQLLTRTGLRDSSKGRGVQPTWPAGNPLLLIPIDHCLHSRDVMILRKKIGPNVGSDHYPVIVDIAIQGRS